MRITRTLLIALLPGALLFSCAKSKPEPPKLIVLIAVDGLRADLLDRYDRAFTWGFRRLRDSGRRFDHAYVDHAITVSHAGHVTLATGVHPNKHGIVDAGFYVPSGNSRRLVDAVVDTTESIPEIPRLPGVSPRRVLRDGIAEWVLHTDPNARTLAVGSGNVSSLLYAFHTPAHVYWYRGAGYVTSSYYREQIAPWVAAFNDSVVTAMSRAGRNWECSVPAALRSLARPDSAAFEGDRTHTTFPHMVDREYAQYIQQNEQMTLLAWLGATPTVDEATLLLAQRGIQEMALGQRESTDCLTIVLSMVDSFSHYYGPFSLEVFDTLVRLDAALGAFFTFLDTTVGADRYVVALSSDHGFPEAPEYRQQTGEAGRRLKAAEIESVMDAVSSITSDEDALDARAPRVSEVMKGYDFVAEVFTPEQLAGHGEGSEFLRLFRNSYRQDRVPRLPIFSLNNLESAIGKAGVMVRLTEGTIIDIDASTHGSAYDYDRHVPLVFMGANIKAGVSEKPARTIDVAPTLARLAGIAAPDDVDGDVLPIK